MKRFHFLLPLFALFLIFAPQLPAGTSNKKKDAFTIRVHGEASPEDGAKFSVPLILLSGKKTVISIMPLLNEHDIKSVYPFQAADGTGGAYLRLDSHGANLLSLYSIEKMGRNSILVVMVNGRQAANLIVDAPVKDGIFVIPSGMSMVDEAHLVNTFPLMGQENNPAQKKKKQPFSPTNILLPPKASDIRNATAPAQ